MGVDSVVPVNESFNINNVACLVNCESIVNVGLGTGKVTLDAEVIVCAVVSNGNVDVITGSAVLVLDRLDGNALEDRELILIIDKISSTKLSGEILCGSNVGISIFNEGEGSINDLYLAGPLSLVAGNLDLGTSGKLSGICFGACHFVNEVSTVLVGSVNGYLVTPPGLSSLNVSFDNNRGFDSGCYVFSVGHNAVIFFILVIVAIGIVVILACIATVVFTLIGVGTFITGVT